MKISSSRNLSGRWSFQPAAVPLPCSLCLSEFRVIQVLGRHGEQCLVYSAQRLWGAVRKSFLHLLQARIRQTDKEHPSPLPVSGNKTEGAPGQSSQLLPQAGEEAGISGGYSPPLLDWFGEEGEQQGKASSPLLTWGSSVRTKQGDGGTAVPAHPLVPK